MTTVEVLAPLRLETRFVPPGERPDGSDQWMLRVRIYPDEFSIRRIVAPPSPDELDRLTEVVTAMSAVPPLDEAAAFGGFAAVVGAARALGLWRRCVVVDGAGVPTVDRSEQADPVSGRVHGPAGLPEQLELWLVFTDGTREQGAVLDLDLDGIGADLDLAVFDDQARLADGELPDTWWLSYPRACAVGLGVDLDVGLTHPSLDALVVIGQGATDAAELVDEHNRGGRLAVLPYGTPTNTVHGEATTDFGDHADTLYPLLHVAPASQSSTEATLTGLTGRVATDALPMLNGDHEYSSAGSLTVQGFWPVLWGRMLRDVTGAGPAEVALGEWARDHLPITVPLPAVRVGDQPYGLLPTSTFELWADEPGDAQAAVEEQILRWALPWRSGAAALARGADRRAENADTAALLDVLGGHAPSRYWRVRPVADLPLIQAARAADSLPPMPATDWDRSTASAWREWPYPENPIGPAARSGPVPGPPLDEQDDDRFLLSMLSMEPESLYHIGLQRPLGLIGHLLRETLLIGRAICGEALTRIGNGFPVELGVALPLDDEIAFIGYVQQGGDDRVSQLGADPDPTAQAIADRFTKMQSALNDFLKRHQVGNDPGPEEVARRAEFFQAVLAGLETAAFRVDPWLTGIAERRLQRMISLGSPFLLGAYGWVDAPAPFDPGRAALAPGPTAAGLLHAPSPAQALTAAVLRDAAVRYPGDDRWQLTIDSAKVRASVALADRVRLGLHPWEALGLEVEKVAGDWESVRILRDTYPLAADQQARRVCDGSAVLRAAREGTLVAGLAPDLPARLAPLDEVLDTYADLLVADGVHALVTGRADLANAAMEAAAGLGAPPELRAIRTPRSAGTTRISAWAVLLPGAEVAPTAGADPVAVADPAFAQMVSDGEDPARLATLLGGDVVPTLTGGAYEGLPGTADADLRAAMLTDLDDRLTNLRQLAQADHDALALLDPADPAVIGAAGRWALEIPVDGTDQDVLDAVTSGLADRLSADIPPPAGGGVGGGSSAVPDIAIDARRQAIRTLLGRPDVPVLPIVDAARLPTLRSTTTLDSSWLEIVSAVRPRLAPLEAHQFENPWPAALAAPDAATDPWHPGGPVLVAYGPGVGEARVAVAALDGWTDSVPSRRHATTAAFGFNAPKSRAPQAVLLAVPPDVSQRLDTAGLLDVVLETRELAAARGARPTDRGGLPYATPAPFVHADPPPLNFLKGWQ